MCNDQDYERQCEAVREVLAVRRKVQMETQQAQKAKKNSLEEIEKAQNSFDEISQAVRRELGHFDMVMREEFEVIERAINEY